MPYAPGTRCSEPSCGELATNRGRCENHQRPAWTHPSKHTQLIEAGPYKKWRAQVIARAHSRCQQCGARGTITDHITPVGEGGALYDPSNGQLLCVSCDAAKTREDIARMAARRRTP